MTTPDVDLVIVFRPKKQALSKEDAKVEATSAEEQYAQLLKTLHDASLKATGRMGDGGDLLVLIWCPWSKMVQLMQRDKHVDFLHGLPSASLPIIAEELQPSKLSPANRLRLVHSLITSSVLEGGLGIVPQSKQWERVECVMTLHDDHFNEQWLHNWTTQQLGFGLKFGALDKIKEQFGEEVALYFCFLSFYAKSLYFPAALGVLFFWLGKPYNAVYSVLLVLWSVTFVEWWSIRERILSVRWGSRGSTSVEKRRPEYVAKAQNDASDAEDDFPWWQREMRVLASVPVILTFAGLLGALLTAIFIFEAFVSQMYTGVGHQYISFAPTIIFIALVPQVLALHHRVAERLTGWENHMHRSSYDGSLTVKVFALSAVVAYLGLALSAFIYVPFGEQVMTFLHTQISPPNATMPAETARTTVAAFAQEQFAMGLGDARKKLDSSRLQKQMFAYMVTNQVVGAFVELVLPIVLRRLQTVQTKGLKALSNGDKHAHAGDVPEEATLLQAVRRQAALPDYTPFADYAEMVTQFGYVTLWSTMWPLSPVMALLNNWLELRGDAFKIAKSFRRPVPTRTDTVGPWLESLGFIAWLAALTNSALVYIFRPAAPTPVAHFGTAVDASAGATAGPSAMLSSLVVPALLIALASSHGYLLARVLVKHVLERLFWKGSAEQRLAERFNREVKVMYLRQVEGQEAGLSGALVAEDDAQAATAFWARDDGAGAIQQRLKEA